MSVVVQNLKAFTWTGLGCGAYVGLTALIGKKKILPERLSRKLMHIGCGPLFSICWPLYAPSPWSPLLAATVPFVAALKFALVGTGTAPDILALVPAITRSKQKDELLRGPFIYGIVHAAIAALFWCRPGGILAIGMLCGGDGMAEVVGASVASPKLPWNRSKSVAGSVACFVGGTVMGMALLNHFVAANALVVSAGASLLPKVALCSLVATVVESLPVPYEGADNLTLPLAVLLTSKAVFG